MSAQGVDERMINVQRYYDCMIYMFNLLLEFPLVVHSQLEQC